MNEKFVVIPPVPTFENKGTEIEVRPYNPFPMQTSEGACALSLCDCICNTSCNKCEFYLEYMADETLKEVEAISNKDKVLSFCKENGLTCMDFIGEYITESITLPLTDKEVVDIAYKLDCNAYSYLEIDDFPAKRTLKEYIKAYSDYLLLYGK